MSTSTTHPFRPGETFTEACRRFPPVLTAAVGGLFLFTGGVHVGIAAADPGTYRSVADASSWDFVRTGWAEIFMAHPAAWGLVVALGEITLGVLLLVGGRPARIGWAGVVAFQGLLVLLGWGYLLWTIPAGVLLVLAARHDWARLATSRRTAA